MNNTMFLRRQSKVCLPLHATIRDQKPKYDSIIAILTVLKNIESLGYTLSSDLLNVLQWYSVEGIRTFSTRLVNDLKMMLGADVKYEPMYPNFPKQVMEASDAELFFNAMMHYWGNWAGLRIMPKYDVDKRAALPKSEMKLTVIELGDEHEFLTIFNNMLNTTTSLSEQDFEDITFFVENYKDEILEYMPNRITHKEVLSFTTNLLLKNITDIHALGHILSKSYSTATDILRLSVAMSDGDVSLSDNTKFRNFNRPERQFLLGLFDELKFYADDIKHRREIFIRLGEKLHPGDYSNRFAQAADIFKKTFNDNLGATFAGSIETILAKGELSDPDISNLLSMLKNRPGELARKLDVLLRRNTYSNSQRAVCQAFEGVARKVSTPVLLQVRNHFMNRYKELPTVIMPKGRTAKTKIMPFDKPEIKRSVCQEISDICLVTLVDRFSKLETLGNVFIDESLKGYLVPFSQRSASKSLKTIVRGSRISLSESQEAVRFFIYWKGGDVDVDLSAAFLKPDFSYHSHVSYTNLRNGDMGSCHSGDITSAPNGAAEFIDINIEAALESGAKYVMMNVYSYSGQKFSDMSKCYAGWMDRSKVNSGEIFSPQTVANKIDVTSETRAVMPLVIDLESREVIWLDLAGMSSNGGWSSTVEANMVGIQATAYAMVNMVKPNLYDLFLMHGVGRGSTFVDTKEEADTVFSIEDGITPFAFDEIIGNYLV
jgi:enamine deaminase RidA (YjgF/YER057c/UK114 family)